MSFQTLYTLRWLITELPPSAKALGEFQFELSLFRQFGGGLISDHTRSLGPVTERMWRKDSLKFVNAMTHIHKRMDNWGIYTARAGYKKSSRWDEIVTNDRIITGTPDIRASNCMETWHLPKRSDPYKILAPLTAFGRWLRLSRLYLYVNVQILYVDTRDGSDRASSSANIYHQIRRLAPYTIDRRLPYHYPDLSRSTTTRTHPRFRG